MNTKAEIGARGEQLAADYLREKGFEIVEMNYRYKHAEIDIIAHYQNLLVFIEVKTKSYTTFGNPELAVNDQKINKLQEGAEHYIESTDWRGDVRFDVVAVITNERGTSIEHFEDAFH